MLDFKYYYTYTQKLLIVHNNGFDQITKVLLAQCLGYRIKLD